MTTTTFDALAYFEKLKAAGVPEEQAKVQAGAIREVIDERAVSREFLDIRLRELELRLTEKIEAGKHEMLKWMVGLIITQSAMLIAIFAFLK